MSAFTERRLYEAANAYYRGAIILMYDKKSSEASAARLDLTQPAVHCAASSLKLYLKCLLAFEGKHAENTAEQLADLYQSLDDDMQGLLLEKFVEYSNTPLSSSDLITHLRMLDGAFAGWQHVFGEAANVNLDELEEMILATKATIADFKPDWQ